MGYSQAGQDAVIEKCKRSCGLCDWKDPCPYSGASKCSEKPSSVQPFCRACETDKVSGVDIEGCEMTCNEENRVCHAVYTSRAARRLAVAGMSLLPMVLPVVAIASTSAS